MILNSATDKVTNLKRSVIEQIYSLFQEKNIDLNVNLCGVKENIVLWKIDALDSLNFYVYTDLNGKLLFGGQIFAYASLFSDFCALVNDSKNWYIINLEKIELVKVLTDKMEWQNIRPIQKGNIALYDSNNKWGSYYFDKYENTLVSDIPFIWDALEFSKNGEKVMAGLCSYQMIENPNAKIWEPENVSMQMKIMEMGKEQAYNLEAYKQFLINSYNNQENCLIIPYKEEISKYQLNDKEVKKQFTMPTYELYEYNGDSRNLLYNICTNKQSEIVDTGSITEYKRVRGRLI